MRRSVRQSEKQPSGWLHRPAASVLRGDELFGSDSHVNECEMTQINSTHHPRAIEEKEGWCARYRLLTICPDVKIRL